MFLGRMLQCANVILRLLDERPAEAFLITEEGLGVCPFGATKLYRKPPPTRLLSCGDSGAALRALRVS